MLWYQRLYSQCSKDDELCFDAWMNCDFNTREITRQFKRRHRRRLSCFSSFLNKKCIAADQNFQCVTEDVSSLPHGHKTSGKCCEGLRCVSNTCVTVLEECEQGKTFGRYCQLKGGGAGAIDGLLAGMGFGLCNTKGECVIESNCTRKVHFGGPCQINGGTHKKGGVCIQNACVPLSALSSSCDETGDAMLSLCLRDASRLIFCHFILFVPFRRYMSGHPSFFHLLSQPRYFL